MRFETAREVLDHAKKFHSQLSVFYQGLATGQCPGKAKLLLNYLVQHEKKLADALRRFENDAPNGVLETWFQYTHDEDNLKIPQQENLPSKESKKSIEGISEYFMAVGDELISLYEEMAKQADEIQLKDIFTNLADMQKQEQRIFSMNVNRLADL